MISAAIERCAGIDVGKKFFGRVCHGGAIKGEPQVEIRKFGTIRAELEGLCEWLKQQGVTHVVMESTVPPNARVLQDFDTRVTKSAPTAQGCPSLPGRIYWAQVPDTEFISISGRT